jgi:hypothetical protein
MIQFCDLLKFQKNIVSVDKIHKGKSKLKKFISASPYSKIL